MTNPESPPFLHTLTRRLRAGSSTSRTSSQSSEPPETDPRSTKKYLAQVVRDDFAWPDSIAPRDVEPARFVVREESGSEGEVVFDSPDDVGKSLARRRARRRRVLEQEMSWNEGLRVWVARRDGWTGVVSKPGKRASQTSASSNMSNDEEHETFLPIYPPLLPASHALRVRISANSYPTIYSKVVIQGLAPNVPISLQHMVGALVHGWKAEGNWPPQSQEVKTVVKKGRQKSAFKRWKAEQEEKKNAAMKQAQAIEWEDKKRRSIGGKMRKALGLGGQEEEEDLEKMGLTFATDEERSEEVVEALKEMKI